jgi:hypothetical protein
MRLGFAVDIDVVVVVDNVTALAVVAGSAGLVLVDRMELNADRTSFAKPFEHLGKRAYLLDGSAVAVDSKGLTLIAVGPTRTTTAQAVHRQTPELELAGTAAAVARLDSGLGSSEWDSTGILGRSRTSSRERT